jgi:hypothetical protein
MSRVCAQLGRDYEHAWAVVRVDDYFDEPLSLANAEERIHVQKVFRTPEEADDQVARLNDQGERSERVRYFSVLTRLWKPPATD